MTEITNDLKSLAELQLPHTEDGRGKQIVKITVLLLATCLLSSLGVVTYALVASLHREDNLKNELGCVRTSAVQIDRRLGEGMSVLVDNDSTLMSALNAVAKDDPDGLDAALVHVDTQIAAGDIAKNNLDKAIEDREAALTQC